MLKKFESFNPFENEFYKEISIEEWKNIWSNRDDLLKLNQLEIDYITNIFNQSDIVEKETEFEFEIYIHLKNPNVGINIIRMRDEWFMIHFRKMSGMSTIANFFYKCDQLGGVEACIKDEISNYKK